MIPCAHCCGTGDPHCPYCHMVAVHGQPVWLMVYDQRGRTVYAGTDQDAAFTTARMVLGILVALPIVVDYRDQDQDHAPEPSPANGESQAQDQARYTDVERFEGPTIGHPRPALVAVPGGPLPKRQTAESVDRARKALLARQNGPGTPETEGWSLGRPVGRHAGTAASGGSWGYDRADG